MRTPLVCLSAALLAACTANKARPGSDSFGDPAESTPHVTDDSGVTDDTATDDTATDDTGNAGTGFEDQDGDGFFAPAAGVDPALTDCDDRDPEVTPATERYLPAGLLLRGEPDSTDAPRQEVQLSAFCLDVYEVTNVPFAAFLSVAGTVDVDGHVLFDEFDSDDTIPERIACDGGICMAEAGFEAHPATELTWYGADAYCLWVGKRLPTEAEWERGARGGCGDDGCDEEDARTWPWGESDPDCDHMNGSEEIAWDENGFPYAFESCVGDTSPVDDPTGDVSPEGLRGMAGNVQELTGDWYNADYYTDGPGTDPPGPESGEFTDPDFGTVYEARVARGGSWASDFSWGVTSRRWGEKPDATSNGLGFRCARPL